MTDTPPPPRATQRLRHAVVAARRAIFESLPGRLLLFTLAFVMLAQLLIFLPLAAQFRTNWLSDQAETAFIAALAADVAQGGTLGDMEVSELLEASDAVAVARVTEGRNELVLYGGPIAAPLVEADLRNEAWLVRISAAARTFTVREERYIRIIANPQARPADIIDVIVPEPALREDLIAYSAGLFQLSLFIAVVTGALLYVTLLYAFVPMPTKARTTARNAASDIVSAPFVLDSTNTRSRSVRSPPSSISSRMRSSLCLRSQAVKTLVTPGSKPLPSRAIRPRSRKRS